MAEIAYSSILSSKPFRFFVGPHRTEFTLHSALVASQSRALDALINGSIKEATAGATTWEHVDEQTFIRFGQYVYTGNYEGEPPLEAEPKVNGGETRKEQKPQAEDDEWSFALPAKITKKKKLVFRAEPVEEFATKREEASYSCGVAGIHFRGKNTDCRVEYQEVFLSHARLHMLAG